MDALLTARIKRAAHELGADLVGVGNIARWTNCPPLMSPAGILPSARSVVVMALHHGDGNIEQGGEVHPQIIGPYASQYIMNEHLDTLSYEIGRLIEDAGHAAVPITASNIWRYRSYKALDAVFAPDMSHIYAAVAAGLAELGFSGLALTPEFGARNRFVSVITDAELEPTPLLAGDTLCDRCMLCAKHCPARTLDKELRGEVALEIEGHRYTRADKNLWRCSWGEHFDLDLDLPIPEKVDEQVLLDNLVQHGRRRGEMGQCLKFCLPPALRGWDRAQTRAPRRKRPRAVEGTPVPRPLLEGIVADAFAHGLDEVRVLDAAALAEQGLPVISALPNASRVVLLIGRATGLAAANPAAGGNPLGWVIGHIVGRDAFFAARKLEAAGYDAVSYPHAGMAEGFGKALEDQIGQPRMAAGLVVTSAALACGTWTAASREDAPADLDADVRRNARAWGADAVGVASAARVDALAAQLDPIFGGDRLLHARHKGTPYIPYDPDVREETRPVFRAADYLPGARSVIVLGNRLQRAAAERLGQPPAEAIGPYAFVLYQSQRALQLTAVQLVKHLTRLGYRCTVTTDLLGTGSLVGNARGAQPDIFSNRFAAVAAGLGTLGTGGFVLTPDFGPRMRFLAIVTDAPLTADALAPASLRAACDAGCTACVGRCTVHAHRPEAMVRIEDQTFAFQPVERARCDWAKRYSLIADEGYGCLGSTLTLMPPETITAESLAAALKQLDPITKERACSAEMCALACPAGQSA